MDTKSKEQCDVPYNMCPYTTPSYRRNAQWWAFVWAAVLLVTICLTITTLGIIHVYMQHNKIFRELNLPNNLPSPKGIATTRIT